MITKHTAETLRAFEQRIVAKFAAGELPFLIHLSGGNEEQLLDVFQFVTEADWVFSNHRSHYHALLKGIPEDEVAAAISSGNSMFIFDRERRFYTSSILAGTCAIACGVAHTLRETRSHSRVWCFIGDGAEDNGHTYEAIRYATAQDLPLTFVIEDNDRQVDTGFAERWGDGERFHWPPQKVIRYHYKPTFPHGGAGLPPGSVKFKPHIVEEFAQ